jgi:hypothetical protein
MTPSDDRRRPGWHAELAHLGQELRRVRTEAEWARRLGQPRHEAALRREAGRIRRRMAHLRGLLGLPEPEADR